MTKILKRLIFIFIVNITIILFNPIDAFADPTVSAASGTGNVTWTATVRVEWNIGNPSVGTWKNGDGTTKKKYSKTLKKVDANNWIKIYGCNTHPSVNFGDDGLAYVVYNNLCYPLQIIQWGDGSNSIITSGATSSDTWNIYAKYVQRIEANAFKNYPGTINIYNDDTAPITYIGNYAFYNSGVQSNYQDNSTILEFVTHNMGTTSYIKKKKYFPEDRLRLKYITNIGSYAFYGCNKLNEVVLSNAAGYTVTNHVTIGDYAFANCPNLKSVYFNNNATYTTYNKSTVFKNSYGDFSLVGVYECDPFTSNYGYSYIKNTADSVTFIANGKSVSGDKSNSYVMNNYKNLSEKNTKYYVDCVGGCVINGIKCDYRVYIWGGRPTFQSGTKSWGVRCKTGSANGDGTKYFAQGNYEFHFYPYNTLGSHPDNPSGEKEFHGIFTGSDCDTQEGYRIYGTHKIFFYPTTNLRLKVSNENYTDVVGCYNGNNDNYSPLSTVDTPAKGLQYSLRSKYMAEVDGTPEKPLKVVYLDYKAVPPVNDAAGLAEDYNKPYGHGSGIGTDFSTGETPYQTAYYHITNSDTEFKSYEITETVFKYSNFDPDNYRPDNKDSNKIFNISGKTYKFNGWYTNSALTTRSNTVSNIQSDVHMYGEFKELTYTVTVNKGTGIDQTTGSGSYTAGTNPVKISATPSTGYVFDKWTVNSGGVTINNNQFTMPSNNVTVTANGRLKKQIVKFNGNGSTSGSMSDQTFNYNVAQNLTANAYKRQFTVTYNYNGSGAANTTATANSTFNGWATAQTGSVAHGDKASLTLKPSSDNSTYPLYAKWTDNGVTLPTPSRTGYTFGGWYKESGCTNKVGSGGASSGAISSNVTFYAKWDKILNKYTITYNGNGATGGSVANGTKTEGQAYTIASNGFSRTGYTFKNWNKAQNGSSTTYKPGDSYTTDAAMTLYAQWDPVIYTITYTLNGGTNNVSNPASYKVTDNDITILDATRQGYSFDGWTGDNGNTAQKSPNSPKITKGSTGNKTYEAHWSPIEVPYTVIHQQEQLDGSYKTVDADTQTLKAKTGTSVTPVTKSYSGFTAPATQTITIKADGTSSVIYKYTRNSYTVTINKGTGIASTSGSGTYKYGATVNAGYTLTAGYTFTGWTGDKTVAEFTMPANAVTMTANAKINTYTVTFNANGHGTAPAKQTINYGSKATKPSDPSETGYSFGGWYKETACTNAYDFNTTITEDKTLYAKWTKVKYTITYDLKGGTVSPANKPEYYIDTDTFTLNNPTKQGYKFTGWSGTNGTTPQTTVTITKGSTGNRTYTTNWTPITYTVKYDANKPSGSSDNVTGSTADSSHTYDVEKALTKNGYSLTGYTFKGWTTNADGTGTAYTNEQSVKNLTSTDKATINLYAKWDINSYTVTVNKGTGIASTKGSGTYKYGDPVTAEYTLLDGYEFDKWTGDKTTATFTMPASNVTITATAKLKTYTVSFDGNGNTGGSMVSQTKTHGKDLTLNANSFVKDGYDFKSWNTKKDGSGTAYANEAVYTANASITLYAQWVKTIRQFAIIYDGNNETSGVMANGIATEGTPYIIEENGFTKTGYTFTGWNTKADGTGKAYAPGSSYTEPSTLTLYAQWEKIVTKAKQGPGGEGIHLELTSNGKIYTVFSLQGGNSLGIQNDCIDHPLPANYQHLKEMITGAGNTFIPEGSVLNDDKKVIFKKVLTVSEEADSDAGTASIDWKDNIIPAVRYVNNGGTGLIPDLVFIDDLRNITSKTISTNKDGDTQIMKKSGYSFKGWNTSYDGTGTWFEPGSDVLPETVRAASQEQGKNILRLYAIWKKDPSTFYSNYQNTGN